MRTITACPGIGDNIWIMQKLINQPERFDFHISDGIPQRGHQLFELLPQVANSCSYVSKAGYRVVNDRNAVIASPRWKGITQQEFYLSANRHLESGARIEQFLPDLPTSFNLDYITSDTDKVARDGILPSGPLIGIYTSAYSNARNWDGWGPKEWLELIELLRPTGATFVIIGATYDVGVVNKLIEEMDRQGIKYIDTTGQPLGVVVEILKRLNYFIGFPSGLSILNETLGKDGLMFYPRHLAKLINTWADPERIRLGQYKGCLFCDPKKIFDWLKSEYKIFDRL